MKHIWLLLGAWSAAAAPLAAQTLPTPDVASLESYDGYRLGPDDEVEVTIFGQGPGQVIKTRVKSDDTITLPFLGAVKVANRTARELAQQITAQLREGGYFVRPVVNVEVTQYVSNAVTVYGEVATPGIYPLDRPLTVNMLIARAGGVRPSGADFAVLKRAGDPAEHRILLSELSGLWSTSTPLGSRDTLYVPVAPIIYVSGQVNSPGTFPMRSGMTVRQALARAGGATLAGSVRNVTIWRGTQKIRKVDLDSPVQPDDTIFVNEKLL